MSFAYVVGQLERKAVVFRCLSFRGFLDEKSPTSEVGLFCGLDFFGRWKAKGYALLSS